MCVFVCVKERDRQTDRQTDRDRQIDTDRQTGRQRHKHRERDREKNDNFRSVKATIADQQRTQCQAFHSHTTKPRRSKSYYYYPRWRKIESKVPACFSTAAALQDPGLRSQAVRGEILWARNSVKQNARGCLPLARSGITQLEAATD